MDAGIIMNMGKVGRAIIMITKMSVGAAMGMRMSAVITIIISTEKNVDAVRSMKMSAVITTIMSTEKNVGAAMSTITSTEKNVGAAMSTITSTKKNVGVVMNTITSTEKNVGAVRSMKMSAAITTIMDMGKNVVTPVIIPMKMMGIAADTDTMVITTTMRTRFSQAGGKRLPINTQTRSLTSC